jgi:hypothetical protein
MLWVLHSGGRARARLAFFGLTSVEALFSDTKKEADHTVRFVAISPPIVPDRLLERRYKPQKESRLFLFDIIDQFSGQANIRPHQIPDMSG